MLVMISLFFFFRASFSHVLPSGIGRDSGSLVLHTVYSISGISDRD